jgi:sterol desaturase/sphingolipid hydroxylase (fatty acid hydroxylase superfamily)
MDIVKIFPLILVGMFVVFIVVEALFPARPLPRVKGWRLTGLVGFVVTMTVSALSPLAYMDFIRAHRIGDLEHLGTVGGAVVHFFALEIVGYWLHRASHANPLWRAYHQVHHSADRVDIYGSAFFHPLEIIVSGVVGAVFGTMLLGVSAPASALATLVAISLSMFVHTNVKTPRWLGYILPRPEGHSVHHQRGRHALNYSRIPALDMLFGTFKNPEYFEPEAGFYPGAGRRIPEMLVGIDVSKPRAARAATEKVMAPGALAS